MYTAHEPTVIQKKIVATIAIITDIKITIFLLCILYSLYNHIIVLKLNVLDTFKQKLDVSKE